MRLRTISVVLLIIVSIIGCTDNLINSDNEFETNNSLHPSEKATMELIQKIDYDLLNDLSVENRDILDTETYLVPRIRNSYSFSESVTIDFSCVYLDLYFRENDNITKSNLKMMILVAYEKENNSNKESFVFNDIEFDLSDMENAIIYNDDEVIVFNVIDLIDSDYYQNMEMNYDWFMDVSHILQEQKEYIINNRATAYNPYRDNREIIYFTLPEITNERIVIDEKTLFFSICTDYSSIGLGAEHGNYWNIEVAYNDKRHEIFKGYLTSGAISYYLVDTGSPMDKKIILNIASEDMIRIVEIYILEEEVQVKNIYYEDELNLLKYENILP